MPEKQNREGVRSGKNQESRECRKNGEAKFASPDGSNEGIGYYFDGEEVGPEEFERLVERKADRIRAEGDDG